MAEKNTKKKRAHKIVHFRLKDIKDIQFAAEMAEVLSRKRHEPVSIADIARDQFKIAIEELKQKFPEIAKRIYSDTSEG